MLEGLSALVVLSSTPAVLSSTPAPSPPPFAPNSFAEDFGFQDEEDCPEGFSRKYTGHRCVGGVAKFPELGKACDCTVDDDGVQSCKQCCKEEQGGQAVFLDGGGSTGSGGNGAGSGTIYDDGHTFLCRWKAPRTCCPCPRARSF